MDGMLLFTWLILFCGNKQLTGDIDNDNSISISHSIVDGGFECESILDADPLFIVKILIISDQSLAIGFGKDLNEGMSNSVRLKIT